MFKLGLMNQAEFDFEVCSRVHPKERLCFFNYALTLLQRDRKERALEVIEQILDKNVKSGQTREEYELMHDAYMLKAQCMWRLKKPIVNQNKAYEKDKGQLEGYMMYEGSPLEAVAAFEMAKKFQARYDDRSKQTYTTQQLEKELMDLAIMELKSDLQQDLMVLEANLSRSPRVKGFN